MLFSDFNSMQNVSPVFVMCHSVEKFHAAAASRLKIITWLSDRIVEKRIRSRNINYCLVIATIAAENSLLLITGLIFYNIIIMLI